MDSIPPQGSWVGDPLYTRLGPPNFSTRRSYWDSYIRPQGSWVADPCGRLGPHFSRRSYGL